MQTPLESQLPLFVSSPKFPSTRFQGSKIKLADWILDIFNSLDFESALDAFGGSGCIAYHLKKIGKRVHYNDILKFNYQIGLALIENDETTISRDDIRYILAEHKQIKYKDIIQRHFKKIFYLDEENEWLDRVACNIHSITNKYKRALAFFALFQACIIKRPFNLFHRNNLYLRTSDVERSFGNKVTWDKPFDEYFVKFANEGNEAVFSNAHKNIASCEDVFDLMCDTDLVYIDTPYLSQKGIGVDYLDFYHFLEGITDYHHWESKLDHDKKHKPLFHQRPAWSDKDRISDAFKQLFYKFRKQIIVVSYRSDGIPTISDLEFMLKRVKSNVAVHFKNNYRYVLSKNVQTSEVLLIGT